MTESNYFDHPALSRSKLCDLKVSPYYFWAKHIAGLVPEQETPAFRIGRAFHCMILEPQEFDKRYAKAPAIDRRTKEGKATWAKFLDESKDKTVLTVEEARSVEDLAHGLKTFGRINQLLEGCDKTEAEYYFDYDGQAFKAKLDAVNTKQHVIIDVKSVCSFSDGYSKFANQAIKHNYAEQVFLYSYAYEQAYGKRPMFLFLAVEKKAPFEVKIYDASDLYAYGQWSVDDLLEQYESYSIDHGQSKDDPWMNEDIIRLQVPSYALAQMNAEPKQPYAVGE